MGDALTVVVERVESFEDKEGAPAAELKLKGGTACLVPRDDRRFAFWSTMLKEDQASGAPVYVAFEPTSRQVKSILSPFARRIEQVGEAPEGEKLAVLIYMSPARHFILTTRPGYAELRSRLEEAVRSGQKLLVTTEPGEMEILDARLPPAAP